LKLLTTALFSVLMLRKQLSIVQWFSLVVLFAGIAIVQLQPQKAGKPVAAEVREQSPTLGLAAVLAACVMSGFASVYFEKLLKHTPPSIYLRNIQLGMIGVVFGLFAAYYNDGAQVGVAFLYRLYIHIQCVQKKRDPNVFCNVFDKTRVILIKFGVPFPE